MSYDDEDFLRDIARLAEWDQTHAKGLAWLHRCVRGMYYPVQTQGPALACAALYDEMRSTADLTIDAMRKVSALAVVELARRDLEAKERADA